MSIKTNTTVTHSPEEVAAHFWGRGHSLAAETVENEVRGIIADAIRADRMHIRAAVDSPQAVPDIRPYPVASISALLDAYDKWNGEVDTFCLAWQAYTSGQDFPCPEHPAGVHSTYLKDDGSCDFCGDKNRG